MKLLFAVFALAMSSAIFAQTPPIEPGVSQELARWRAARYSDVRYKLNLTLEKMSPVLKGTMEIRLNVKSSPPYEGGVAAGRGGSLLVLDWRKVRGYEERSTISNVSINGRAASPARNGENHPVAEAATPLLRKEGSLVYREQNEHLIFRDGVVAGENVIKLDFTSPILTSGSAITRYVDKEDGSEYIYSLFVPSDASTAFPVFDQPDLKARFTVSATKPSEWSFITNTATYSLLDNQAGFETKPISTYVFAFAAGPWERVSSPHVSKGADGPGGLQAPSITVGLRTPAADTGGNPSSSEGAQRGASDPRPLSTGRVSASGSEPPAVAGGLASQPRTSGEKNSSVPAGSNTGLQPPATAGGTDKTADPPTSIYVRKSQAAKFKPHAAEVFRLNREAVKYFEQYFDYKFPFPKYDLVLIPEFPFGGMEHAGATFLRESAVIFPQEPTKNDLASRATLIFHEAAHQWFGDTVTMRWFDDLWLKEGFATFTAYKAMEKIMPEMNAWKVFYERIKQGAYQTDSTRGTTAIYQPIANLSAAKSAYGNIVYNKAPAFLRQAEFYFGEKEFQTGVRAFLKKHEFGNAGWEDLVKEFEEASGGSDLLEWWAEKWVTERGLPVVRSSVALVEKGCFVLDFRESVDGKDIVDGWRMRVRSLMRFAKTSRSTDHVLWGISGFAGCDGAAPQLLFPNYGDYGYGIFLLDEKSRDHVLKNIQNEKDPFLRSMLWGALWDSVREGELDPRVFVELVVKVLGSSSSPKAENHPVAEAATPLLRKEGSRTEEDESTIATLLGRTGTALNYYIDDSVRSPRVSKGADGPAGSQAPSLTVGLRTQPAASRTADLRTRVEDMLIERMRSAPSLGQRITYYRALLNIAASEKARGVLKGLLASVSSPTVKEGSTRPVRNDAPSLTVGLRTPAAAASIPLKTKDRFDIVTRLLILGDPEGPKLLADLEKTETSDDAKRYAYAARAGIGTAENKAKYWKDFTENKEISESWIEAAFGPWNSIRHSDLTLPYLQRALQELPNHKRNRKIFFVNGWLGAFIGGQRSAEALAVVNKFLADNPGLDNDLRLKVLENVDLIERAVRIRGKY